MKNAWKMSSMPKREAVSSTPSKSARVPAKAATAVEWLMRRASPMMLSTVAVPNSAVMIRQPSGE